MLAQTAGDIGSRVVEIAGIARDPGGDWIMQVARNPLGADDGVLAGKRYLLMDRDPLFTIDLREMLNAAGVEAVRLSARSPNLNAYAERFALSVRSECLDRIVPLGEWHLRCAVAEYVAHYYSERNHQGLDNELVNRTPVPANTNGRAHRRERLGGLLNFYCREAA
jgi:hypothetical protein